MQTILNDVRTIQGKKKQFILSPVKFEKKKQVPVLESSKKSLLKNLIISSLSLIEVSDFNGHKIYCFLSDITDTTFYIFEDIMTNEKVLHQEEYILDENTAFCQLLLNKLAA